MPILQQEGVMTIVAHIDDDLLFMNPDIAAGIAAGDVSTSVFVTAGDAGGEDWYWQGREEGAKAAYSLMAGAEDWVDEVVTIEQADKAFDVTSSYLESAPEVRLYFLRLPDGAGAIADPADYESLARLEDGTRTTVDTVDGAATYTRSDLADVLTGLMEAMPRRSFACRWPRATLQPANIPITCTARNSRLKPWPGSAAPSTRYRISSITSLTNLRRTCRMRMRRFRLK